MADRESHGPLGEVLAELPHWLRWSGVSGWLFAGTIGLLAAIFWVVSYTAGLIVPLAVAAVLGILFAPLVEWLARHRVPRAVGAAGVLVLLLAIVVFTVWLVANGVIGQSAVIGEQVTAGVNSVTAWLQSLDLPKDFIDQTIERVSTALQGASGSIASALSKGLSGTLAVFSGLFLGSFMLFFILKDWDSLCEWVGGHLGVPAETGAGLIGDAVGAMRAYFGSVTVTGFVVAAIVGVAVWLMGLPLAIPIALVTWLTCYIPYVGALISGAFAVLVALGAGGVGLALGVLVVILLAQNVVQTVIQNNLASERLSIHPLASLIATIFGGIVGGLLGAMLAPALLAFGLRAYVRLRKARSELAPMAAKVDSIEGGEASPDSAAPAESTAGDMPAAGTVAN